MNTTCRRRTLNEGGTTGEVNMLTQGNRMRPPVRIPADGRRESDISGNRLVIDAQILCLQCGESTVMVRVLN
jgi:hypothetical protein